MVWAAFPAKTAVTALSEFMTKLIVGEVPEASPVQPVKREFDGHDAAAVATSFKSNVDDPSGEAVPGPETETVNV
jgi:hypothetical protein